MIRILSVLAAVAIVLTVFLPKMGIESPVLATPPTGVPRALIAAPGRVEPLSEEIKVAAAITGRLAEVRVKEGQRVVANEILAVIQNAEHLARLQQAEAAVRLKTAVLRRVRNGPRHAERQEAQANVREARSALPETQAELKRQEALARSGTSSQQLVERARHAHEAAQARLAAAIGHLNGIDAEARPEDIDEAEADLSIATARVSELRASYDNTFIRSPIAGIVLRTYRRVGEMVTESVESPIVSVGDDRILRVRAEVDESEIALLRLGQPAYVQARAYGERRFPGYVSQIGSMLGPKVIRTEQPGELVDTRVVDVLIDLASGSPLLIGLRTDVFISFDEPAGKTPEFGLAGCSP